MRKSLSYFANKFFEELKSNPTEQTILSIRNKILNLKHKDGTYLNTTEIKNILFYMNEHIDNLKFIHSLKNNLIIFDSNTAFLTLVALITEIIGTSNTYNKPVTKKGNKK